MLEERSTKKRLIQLAMISQSTFYFYDRATFRCLTHFHLTDVCIIAIYYYYFNSIFFFIKSQIPTLMSISVPLGFMPAD